MKKTLIVGIIGLALILAAVGGFLFLFNEVSPTLPGEETDTTDVVTSKPSNPSEPSGGSSNSGDSGNVNDTIHLDDSGNFGYAVVNGFTYFFQKVYNGGGTTLYWNSSEGQIKQYGDYDLYIAFSTKALDWELDEYEIHAIPLKKQSTTYISYTRIYNCANPGYVLEDLKQHVFGNPEFIRYQIDYAPIG